MDWPLGGRADNCYQAGGNWSNCSRRRLAQCCCWERGEHLHVSHRPISHATLQCWACAIGDRPGQARRPVLCRGQCARAGTAPGFPQLEYEQTDECVQHLRDRSSRLAMDPSCGANNKLYSSAPLSKQISASACLPACSLSSVTAVCNLKYTRGRC